MARVGTARRRAFAHPTRGRKDRSMRMLALSTFAVALLALLPASASAETYPSRTVSVVVPFPAGGSVDGVARILVQKLNETVGQHFIVENRPGGASGTVGANAVAKAPPDGYTLLLSASVHVINPFLYMSVQIQLLADPMLSSLPLAQGGKIKALGLTSLKRAAAAPEIPTVEESGVKGFQLVSWYGLWGPKSLPADVSDKLQAEIAKVLALADTRQRLSALGFDPIGAGGAQFAAYIRDEMAKYEGIIRDAKIRVE